MFSYIYIYIYICDYCINTYIYMILYMIIHVYICICQCYFRTAFGKGWNEQPHSKRFNSGEAFFELAFYQLAKWKTP